MTPETKAILDAATPNSHSELENSIDSLSETAFHCLGRYQKRYEADQLLIAELVKALKDMDSMSGGRWSEWGGRAMSVSDILQAALAHAREQKPELGK